MKQNSLASKDHIHSNKKIYDSFPSHHLSLLLLSASLLAQPLTSPAIDNLVAKHRYFDADAFVMFQLDEQGKGSGIKMKAISLLTDFSYDFHDLDFHR